LDFFVDYQRFALKKYHENITFLSQPGTYAPYIIMILPYAIFNQSFSYYRYGATRWRGRANNMQYYTILLTFPNFVENIFFDDAGLCLIAGLVES
jgi:hypothetical protein